MRALLSVVAALIAYGSLYPFSWATNEGSLHEVAAMLRDLSISASRGDIVGNLLLFAPYGFLAALARERDAAANGTVAVSVVLGLVLAVALQVVQVWIPTRVPALGDAVVNGFGLLLGYLAGVVGRGRWPAGPRGNDPVMLVPLGLMLLWLAYQWFPLVPTLDLQNVRNALKPLLARAQLDFAAALLNAVAWLTFFKVSSFTPLKDVRLAWLGIAAIAITLGQVLFLGGRVSLADVIGVSLALAALPLLTRPLVSSLLCAALLVSLLTAGLQPFRATAVPNTFHWIPFSGLLEGSMEGNTRNLVEKLYLYGSAVFLLSRNGATLTGASLAVALVLAVVEGAQIMLVGRTAETTDPLLALLIGYVIARLTPDASRPPARAVPARQSGARHEREPPRLESADSRAGSRVSFEKGDPSAEARRTHT